MVSLLKPEKELQRGYKNSKRLSFVAQYDCMACEMKEERQTTRTIVHHLAGIGGGKKASDLLTFAICEMHHNHDEGEIGITLHKGIAKFEENFKSQIEFIGLVNEMIFRDNNLKGQDLKNYELVKNYIQQKLK